MKRYLALLFICVFAVSTAFAASLTGKTMYVNVKSSPLKASTSLFSDTTGTLAYGDSVSVLKEDGKWVQVKSSKFTGWMVSANLTAKRIIASSSSASASTEELALAGKGFSPEVEKEYRKDGKLNYADIDAMEKINVSDSDAYIFLTDGHLSTGGAK